MDNSDWIKTFDEEDSPLEMKNSLLNLSSAVFRMISETDENERKEYPLNLERRTMDELIEIAKFGVMGFYKDNLEFGIIKKEIRKFLEKKINLESYRPIYQRHLKDDEDLVKRFMLEMKTSEFDVIIPVMNGGFEPALLLNSRQGIIPIRYSVLKYSDRSPYIPECYKKDLKNDIKDKEILIMEDLIATGESILGVANFVKNFCPEEIYLSTAKWETAKICGEEKIKEIFWRYK